ncbi:MAG: hypothetical protein AAFO91_13500 [Bacteroidota bacterium]
MFVSNCSQPSQLILTLYRADLESSEDSDDLNEYDESKLADESAIDQTVNNE